MRESILDRPACHEPIERSPSAVLSHTTPSESMRPNAWSPCGTGACVGGIAADGLGPGPRSGARPGRGAGAGRGVPWSFAVGSVGLVICSHVLHSFVPRVAAAVIADIGDHSDMERRSSPPFKQFRRVGVASSRVFRRLSTDVLADGCVVDHAVVAGRRRGASRCRPDTAARCSDTVAHCVGPRRLRSECALGGATTGRSPGDGHGRGT